MHRGLWPHGTWRLTCEHPGHSQARGLRRCLHPEAGRFSCATRWWVGRLGCLQPILGAGWVLTPLDWDTCRRSPRPCGPPRVRHQGRFDTGGCEGKGHAKTWPGFTTCTEALAPLCSCGRSPPAPTSPASLPTTRPRSFSFIATLGSATRLCTPCCARWGPTSLKPLKSAAAAAPKHLRTSIRAGQGQGYRCHHCHRHGAGGAKWSQPGFSRIGVQWLLGPLRSRTHTHRFSLAFMQCFNVSVDSPLTPKEAETMAWCAWHGGEGRHIVAGLSRGDKSTHAATSVSVHKNSRSCAAGC